MVGSVLGDSVFFLEHEKAQDREILQDIESECVYTAYTASAGRINLGNGTSSGLFDLGFSLMRRIGILGYLKTLKQEGFAFAAQKGKKIRSRPVGSEVGFIKVLPGSSKL